MDIAVVGAGASSDWRMPISRPAPDAELRSSTRPEGLMGALWSPAELTVDPRQIVHLNAGAWSIGVAGTGNGIGLSREEFRSLPPYERQSVLSKSRPELERSGAHYVIDTLAELDSILDDINVRLLH